MSEHFTQPESSKKAANAVEEMQSIEGLLSPTDQYLTKIDSLVSEEVETDPNSEDFGRIKNIDMAQKMATRQGELYEEIANNKTFVEVVNEGRFVDTTNNPQDNLRQANEQVDAEVASDIFTQVRYGVDYPSAQEANEVARKVATDYQITQGNEDALARRRGAIMRGVEKSVGGGYKAASAAVHAAVQSSKAKTNR